MKENKQPTGQARTSEKDFLEAFESFRFLEQKVDDLESEVGKLQGAILVKNKVGNLANRMAAFEDLFLETISEKQRESLYFLDRHFLHRHLGELLLIMLDHVESGTWDEYPEKTRDTEKRALGYLYLLSRWIESNHRFPGAEEMHKLLENSVEDITNLSSILSKSLKTSPQVKSQLKRQRAAALRNCVGVGDNDTE